MLHITFIFLHDYANINTTRFLVLFACTESINFQWDPVKLKYFFRSRKNCLFKFRVRSASEASYLWLFISDSALEILKS